MSTTIRGIRLAVPLALVCTLAASCASVTDVVGLPTAPHSPDPKISIALSVLSDSVYVVDPATGQEEAVATGLVNFQAGYATWAPDHRRLLYGNGGLSLVEVGGGRPRQLNRGQTISMPAFSPSGKQIVYGDGVAMWVAGANASEPLRLHLPETLAPQAMTWRPARAIAFQGLQLDCNQPGPCLSTETSDIWTIRPDGSGLAQVTHLGGCGNPKWSPDGSRILFIRHRTVKKTLHSDVWTIRPNGTDLRRLLPLNGVIAADWSADGSQIAIARSGETSPAQTVQVWIARADGSSLHRVGGPFFGSDATIDW